MIGRVIGSRESLGLILAVGLNFQAALAQPIDTGLFTQNNLRQCSSDNACIGGDPSLVIDSDYDLSVTGAVMTQVSIVELGAQSGTTAGYDGAGLAPAMSIYAYTSGPQRYTVATFGFQKYTFLEAGQVTLSGTLTYEQTGQTFPSNENPRGRVRADFMSFGFDDDEFDGGDCNLFSDYSAWNVSGSLSACVTLNGQLLGDTIVEFIGLKNVQVVPFPTISEAVSDGEVEAELVVTGEAGDVFFIGADLSVQAHLGGFGDTGNSLRIEIDRPEILQPAFNMASYEPAPARMVSIDILPGDEPNCVNINDHGVVPVAVLGSDILHAEDIDPATLSLSGLVVRQRGAKGPLCHIEQINGDEFADLVCQFEDDAGAWSPGDGEAMLSGARWDGSEFVGIDTICL